VGEALADGVVMLVVVLVVVAVVAGSGTGGFGVSCGVAAVAGAAIKSSMASVSRTTAGRVEGIGGWTL
jgi:hypothetical protein